MRVKEGDLAFQPYVDHNQGPAAEYRGQRAMSVATQPMAMDWNAADAQDGPKASQYTKSSCSEKEVLEQ